MIFRGISQNTRDTKVPLILELPFQGQLGKISSGMFSFAFEIQGISEMLADPMAFWFFYCKI